MTDRQPFEVPPQNLGPADRLRQDVTSCLAAGDLHRATHAARVLLERDPGRRTHAFLRECARKSGASSSALKPIKVALLSSFSIEFLHDSLIALGFASGLNIEIHQSGFGTFRQELLDPSSSLYRAAPDVVVLAVEAADWTRSADAGFLDTDEGGIGAAVDAFRNELAALVAALRSRSNAPLLVQNLALPAWRKLGIFDAKANNGQGALLARLNDTVAKVARESTDVHVVDYAALVNRHGALNWFDDRMRLYARAPVANAMQPHLSAEYVKFMLALAGLTKKCLVVDLDNTLWGGVIGEEGVDGIALGPTYPGSAYVEFQRYVLDLHRRGIIIAAASKNNPADVDEALENHRFMLLRKEHFADMQIHWEPKSQSVARIAQNLSIGLEHVVLVDDNPAECEEVRRALPMVRVIELPPHPEMFVRTLQQAALFETLALSDEDRRRGELYRQRAQAEAARSTMTSLEDYYRDLAMEVRIAPVDAASLARTAQLTQKTNQFNVTTFRYSEAEVADRAANPQWIVRTVAVKDRFGDNGIVGVMMAQANGTEMRIDTFLLSCRVIGRTIETAMLAELCSDTRRRGLGALRGQVIPTAKNSPARDLFERHGFSMAPGGEQGTTLWRLDTAAQDVAWPDWLARVG